MNKHIIAAILTAFAAAPAWATPDSVCGNGQHTGNPHCTTPPSGNQGGGAGGQGGAGGNGYGGQGGQGGIGQGVKGGEGGSVIGSGNSANHNDNRKQP